MIIMRLPRNHVQEIRDSFFPFFDAAKLTRLKDVAHHGSNSNEFLGAIMTNCLLDEVQDLFIKKLINTTGKVIKFQFSNAQAVVLFLALIKYPLHKDHFYLQKIRNEWIQVLDQLLIKEQVIQQMKFKPDAATSPMDYYEM